MAEPTIAGLDRDDLYLGNTVEKVIIVGGGGTGGVDLPISANDVTETTARQFVTAAQKAQIDLNKQTMELQATRVTDVENRLDQVVTTDEKVKMNASGVASYLADMIDGSTIRNVGGKLEATKLSGVTTTVAEMNYLTGTTSNVQGQINALSNIGNFTTTVQTHADLAGIATPQEKDMVIVIADETKGGSSTIYIRSASNWIYAGEFKGGEIRDFTTNPIRLESEVIGLLTKNLYEKQNASDTAIRDTGGIFTAVNVEDALVELFQYANNGKASIATAVGSPLTRSDTFSEMKQKIEDLKAELAASIQGKGVPSQATDPLGAMALQIAAIPVVTVGGSIKKMSQLNIVAPMTVDVPLIEDFEETDITTSLIVYQPGQTGKLLYSVGFDNTDAQYFVPNKYVIFDGKMKLNKKFEVVSIIDGDFTGDGTVKRSGILPRDEWESLDQIQMEVKL